MKKIHDRIYRLQEEIRAGKLDNLTIVMILQGIRSDIYNKLPNVAQAQASAEAQQIAHVVRPCPFCGIGPSSMTIGETTKYFCAVPGCPANVRNPAYVTADKWNQRA